ncbi:MAG TPA: cyclase family protein [Candidatus Binatia bacterium]|nr:cyclase family protein [Candidatus Binatia bacterium]
MKRLLFLLSLVCVSCSPVEQGLFRGQWVDLSHDFSAETIYWPTARVFEKTTVFQGYTPLGFYYTAYDFCAAEHGGTHIDAPIHFAKDRRTVDEIPVDQLIGAGVIIRIAEKVKMDRNYQLTTDDILAWEKEYGKVPDNSILLIDTGSSRFWPNKREYMGTDERGEEGVKKLKFPGIHPDTAKFLVSERKIKAVGLDTPSLDYGGSTRFETHQILFERNIPGFENVTNLGKLPVKGALIFALPMKIKGGSGGPLRIVAWIPAK